MNSKSSILSVLVASLATGCGSSGGSSPTSSGPDYRIVGPDGGAPTATEGEALRLSVVEVAADGTTTPLPSGVTVVWSGPPQETALPEGSTPAQSIHPQPGATATGMWVRNAEHLNEQEQQVLSFICQEQTVQVASTLAQQFVAMVQHRQAEHFDLWLEGALHSGIPDIQTVAEGFQKEYAPVKAALTFSYSNGPVEGLVTKLKYRKRSLYGRGSFEWLRQRFLRAA